MGRPKNVRLMRRSQVEDLMWNSLVGAIFGSTTVTLSVGVIILAFVAPVPGGVRVALVAISVAAAAAGWWGAKPWVTAHDELVRRREEAEDQIDTDRRARRPRSTQPSVVYDPAKWTGA